MKFMGSSVQNIHTSFTLKTEANRGHFGEWNTGCCGSMVSEKRVNTLLKCIIGSCSQNCSFFPQ